MEFPNLENQHCSNKECKMLDILPLKCDECGLLFCAKHLQDHRNECKKRPPISGPSKSLNYFTCNHKNCNTKSVIQMLCRKCNQHFCIQHRHIDECRPIELLKRAKFRQDYINNLKQYYVAKAEIDKQFREKAQKLKKPKDRLMIQKIQLMRIKSIAIGNKNIPTENRLYFKINHKRSIKGSVRTILYIDKNWLLKQAINDIIKKCELNPKRNADFNDVILIRISDNSILNDDSNIEHSLEALVKNSLVADGDELILKFISDDKLEIKLQPEIA